MARITNITINNEDAVGRGVVLTLDNGEALTLTFSDAGIIKTQMLLRELRDGIRNALDDEIDNGYIDLGKYDGNREDFEEEIYTDLADEIENDDYTALCNDGEWIHERITDTANFYELEPDEEDDEDDYEEGDE